MPPLKALIRALSVPSVFAAIALRPSIADTPLAPAAPQQVFQPTWSSLEANYQAPEWFRDAKFGIWAHWGPQAEPEQGDWYARRMYVQGEKQYDYQVAHYGHPSKVGFKDIIHLWKAENFDPDKLLAFYRQCGARYFMALANHHDNFDNFNSKFQPWNAVNMGPHKDLIALWEAAARKNGLRFGVSVHASRSWTWYEPAQGSDATGPLAGVPYDGRLTKADGKGQWWEGYDSQDLYAQNHPLHAPPSAAYLDKFFKRIRQLVDDYQPDLLYFDDGVLPQHTVDEKDGLDLVAHFYNESQRLHGRNEAVVNTKGLNADQRRALVYDIERGKARTILPQPWQTDTCLGQWHYDRSIYQNHQYKTAPVVIRMLVDIVSRNGNLMLSVPVRADGTIDGDEIDTVQGVGRWLTVNGEAIYATRPWKTYGEGPSLNEPEAASRFGGALDVSPISYTGADIRFTQSKDGNLLYAIALAVPSSGELLVKSLARGAAGVPPALDREIADVSLLGSPASLKWTRDQSGLRIKLPPVPPTTAAIAVRVRLQ